MKTELERQVLSTSRELEYFSESELTTQTGYAKEQWWPGVIVKELTDNSLDACEQAGMAPVIAVDFLGDSIQISDNGLGIPGEVVEKILDFSTRTSDKVGYVSPTRGAQGNAFKTVFAIPYVLSGETGITEITSCGLRHRVALSTDHIAQRPRINHQIEQIVNTEGTSIRVELDSASSNGLPPDPGFLQKLILDYALFNPHADFTLRQADQEERFAATNLGWRKWLPTHPTSAHWYDPERLENLVASYLATERHGSRVRTVREFVSEFKGLAGTAKQKKVTGQLGLSRAYLRDLVDSNDKLDRQLLEQLLGAMQECSAPVKPEALGVLGQDHYRQRLHDAKGGDHTFRYARMKGLDSRGLPFVVECAFAMTEDDLLRGLHIGLNWSVHLANPIQQIKFALGDDGDQYGLSALLAHSRIDPDRDPVCLAIHLICPRFEFLDRGKGSVSL